MPDQLLDYVIVVVLVFVLVTVCGLLVDYRRVGRWVLALLSAWLLLSSLLIWAETDDGSTGIWQALVARAPLWTIAVPLIGMISLIALWRNPPGTYWLIFPLGIVMIIAAIASTGSLDAVEGIEPGWGPTLAIPTGIVYTLIALFMAMGDAVPMGSPLARLVYMSRFGHLQNLYRLAERWDWEAWGPEGPHHVVIVKGRWDGRELSIESGAIRRLSDDPESSYLFLRVAVGSKRALWPLYVGVGESDPDKAERQSALRSTCRNAKGKTTAFYLWVPPGRVVTEEALYPFQDTLESGRRLFAQPNLGMHLR